MKKIILLTVAMVLVASTVFAWSIVGSRHDLSSAGVAGGQVCVFCHTPHNANTSQGPLWSHSASAATFTPYASATLNGTITQPAGVSKACMGCHDGTIAIGAIAFGRSAASVDPAAHDGAHEYAAGATMIDDAGITGNPLLGTDLRDDHPVSITYLDTVPSAGADGSGLRTPTGNLVVGTVTVQLFGTASPYTVECASCHDVHNNTNVPFLVTANTNSQICTACHLK